MENNEKRYVAVVDFYVWAQSDEDALRQAEDICNMIKEKDDNGASIIEMAENKPGINNNREIYPNSEQLPS